MNLAELARRVGITPEELTHVPSGGAGLQCPFDVTAEDFLEQAEEDFDAGGRAAQMNALTNAKRAIDCQIDTVVAALGFRAHQSRKARLTLLVDSGFIVPRILKRAIDARNLLEHEYRSPSEDEIAEAIDIAALFVGAIARHFEGFEGDYYLGNESEWVEGRDEFSRQLLVSFVHTDHHFWIRGLRHDMDPRGELLQGEAANKARVIPHLVGECSVTPADAAYIHLVRLATTQDRDARVEKAIAKLREYLLA